MEDVRESCDRSKQHDQILHISISAEKLTINWPAINIALLAITKKPFHSLEE